MRRQPSLRSQLNQIRLWVRQGRTDAWIAHKIDVSIEQLERFKKDHDLDGEGAAPGRPADPLSVPPPEPESYMTPEDDDEDEPEEPEVLEVRAPRARPRRGSGRDRQPARERDRQRERDDERDEEQEEELGSKGGREREDGRDGQGEADAPARSRRRRGRRGGRGRRRPSSFEATFDHGEEGYGLWLDPAVVENPVYSEHWAGHRAVVVTFDRDAITIRRAESDGAEHDEPGPEP